MAVVVARTDATPENLAGISCSSCGQEVAIPLSASAAEVCVAVAVFDVFHEDCAVEVSPC